MARANKKKRLIEFKGVTLPIVSISLRSLHPDHLANTAKELFGDEDFFDGDAAVLELDQIEAGEETTPDWANIRALFERHGLRVIGVRGANDTLRESATAAGLPSFAAFKRHTDSPEGAIPDDSNANSVSSPDSPSDPSPQPELPLQEVAQAVSTPTQIIDRPLRSGQQMYARGGDLVVLAAVNAGAEVIADGSIHIYAPLRGRALAGASGETSARIFTTCFEAELVSIAGVYRTFEVGPPDGLARRPVQVQLTSENSENINQLTINALKTD